MMSPILPRALFLACTLINLHAYATSNHPVSFQVIQTTPVYAQVALTNHTTDKLSVVYRLTGNHPDVNLTQQNDHNSPTTCTALDLDERCTIGLYNLNRSHIGTSDEGELLVQVFDQNTLIDEARFKLSSSTYLYAGGDFTYAYNADGSAVNVNHIARWNGVTWSALDANGISGDEVQALGVGHDGLVYVGGFFKDAGGNPASAIASWNASTQKWSSLSGGVTSANPPAGVSAITTGQDGAVYAGGSFDYAGGIPARDIARWDGTTWSALGAMNLDVHALMTGPDGLIYVAGGLYTWNPLTQEWSTFFNWGVYGLTFDKNGLIDMTGTFVPNSSLSNIYSTFRWDPKTQQVSPIGDGRPSWQTMSITIGTDGVIYVGGNADSASNYILKYDGTNWLPLGGHLNGIPDTLITDSSGHIYAGGLFTSTGTIAANYIAMWDPATSQWSTFAKGFNSYVRSLLIASTMQVMSLP